MEKWNTAIREAQTFSRMHVLLGMLDACIKWDMSAENARCKVCRKKGEETLRVPVSEPISSQYLLLPGCYGLVALSPLCIMSRPRIWSFLCGVYRCCPCGFPPGFLTQSKDMQSSTFSALANLVSVCFSRRGRQVDSL